MSIPIYKMKVPKGIKVRIENAQYFLWCADALPPPTRNAAHILLLLIGWENVIIAQDELDAWIAKKKVDPKLYTDHTYKFTKAGSITHIILGQNGTESKTVTYSSPGELKKLREYCQYGFGSDSKSVAESFGSTWHADIFRNRLISKIQWTGALVSAIENLHEK